MTSYKAIDVYASAIQRIDELLASNSDPKTIYARFCAILDETVPHYTWVGIYLVEGADLVLAGWSGPAATEHVRIPVGKGICGYAAAHAESIIVPDVSQDPRYLQCFLDTRSEIVVPISHQGDILGEIDIDSNQLNAFGAADQEFLEELAGRLAPVIAG